MTTISEIIWDVLVKQGERFDRLEARLDALENGVTPEEINNDGEVGSLTEFLRSHPGVKFTTSTIQINTGLSADQLFQTLRREYTFGSIKKGLHLATGAVFWYYEGG